MPYRDHTLPYHVRKEREQQEKEEQEAQRRDAWLEHGYVPDKNGHWVHHTSEENNARAPNRHPWLPGRAEERVQEEEDPNKQLEEQRLEALNHGYDVVNGHYVPLTDNGRKHTRKPLKPLPREPLPREPLPRTQTLSREPLSREQTLSRELQSSSTYMVCTQAAGNSALVPLPTFVTRS